MKLYYCPKCNHEISFDSLNDITDCPACGASIRKYDANGNFNSGLFCIGENYMAERANGVSSELPA